MGLLDSGLRLLLCERAWDRAGAAIGQGGAFEIDAARAETCLARIADLHKRWNGQGDGRVRVGLAAWAPELCSPDLLGRLRRLQGELDVIASVHLNQIWGEVAAVREQRGVLPTEYLRDVGFLSHRLVAAHCRCMTAEEERILGAAGVAVAVNSAIAARRGLAARVHELEQAGCLIALGTDNMAEDMVEVVRTALFMERVRRHDGRQPTPEQALGWATRNGYRALGITDGGWLAEGNLRRPDRDRSAQAAPDAGPARRLGLRAPGSGERRRGRHGGRTLHHARRTRADARRAGHRRRGRSDRARGMGTAVQGAPRSAASGRLRPPSG